MTHHIILIRHSISAPLPDTPQEEWQLTPEGEERCLTMAAELREYTLDRIFTSTEAKAIATGKIPAEELNIPWQTTPNLQETARGDSDYFEDKAAFAVAVDRAMQQPDQIIFGSEAFAEARERFLKQMHIVIEQHPKETIALVSHGRVLAMVLGKLQQRNPFDLWQSLKMPDFVVFRLPDWELLSCAPHLHD